MQELYSNNCNGFLRQLNHPTREYRDIFEDFTFTTNPLLSFSDKIKHPAKYAYGVKNFGTKSPLTPDYDINGRPHHPILGKLYGIVLDQAAVEELSAYNVYKMHEKNYLKLHTHYANDIYSEGEISIGGYIPGEYVVFEHSLSVPSFNGDYRPYYRGKYGLTETRFNNAKIVIASPTANLADKKKKEKKIIEEIISANKQDNALIYKNCIDEYIPNMFEEELRRLDVKISKLQIDYTIE